MSTPPDDTQQVRITRVFDAPRELVFRAWSDPELLARWFAPDGCTVLIRRYDFRPGGTFHTCIRNPQYGDCWCTGTFREIVAPEKFVYSVALADEKGDRAESAAFMKDPEWPVETLVTVTFTERDGKTTLILQQNVLESVAKRTGAHPGWLQMLDHLAAVLAKA